MAEAKSAPKQATRHFKFLKETSGTCRFDEIEEAGKPTLIGTLYLRKEALRIEELSTPHTLDVQVTITG